MSRESRIPALGTGGSEKNFGGSFPGRDVFPSLELRPGGVGQGRRLGELTHVPDKCDVFHLSLDELTAVDFRSL